MHSQQQEYILDIYCICVVSPSVCIWNASLDSTEDSHIRLLFKGKECGEARRGNADKALGVRDIPQLRPPPMGPMALLCWNWLWRAWTEICFWELRGAASGTSLGHLIKPDLSKQLRQIHALWKDSNPGSDQGNWDFNPHIINSNALILAKNQKPNHTNFPEPGKNSCVSRTCRTPLSPQNFWINCDCTTSCNVVRYYFLWPCPWCRKW